MRMRIKLVRKFADLINGVDLTKIRVGDVFDLKPRDAHMLIAEGWAEPMTPARLSNSPSIPQTTSDDSVT
jgi:hypothetical protein